MTRIGISQRVTIVSDYNERRDCLDQRWTPLLHSLDYVPVPLPNRIADVDRHLEEFELDGFVLTGGNNFAYLDDATEPAPERDRFERAVLEYAISNQVPVLGVCRGAQLINQYFGGSIHAIEDHATTTHEVKITGAPIEAPELIKTNSYHDYGFGVDEVGDGIRIVGRAADGIVEWIEHETLSIGGILWHPERDSPCPELDRRIIASRFGGHRQ